jgi:SAM-dependent methyltransferase
MSENVKQRAIHWLGRGFSDPSGLPGRFAAVVMAHHRSSVRRSHWAVNLLDLQPTDRFLEVGSGPGVALAAARRRTQHVVGVDRAPIMVHAARRRSGATVLEADAVHLPAFDDPFDKALAINTHAFWSDTVAGFRAIHDALRRGGTIAVVSQPRGDVYRDPDVVPRHLIDAGFTVVRTETLTTIEPPAVCVLATRS